MALGANSLGDRQPLPTLAARFGRAALLALAAVALLTLSPHRVDGQEAYRAAIDQVVVSEDGDSATAFLSVTDASGQPVSDVQDFDASVDGQSSVVTSVESVVNEQTGVSVLLAMDISDSMAGEKLDQARAAAIAFVQGLLPEDVTALMTFGPEVGEGTGFTDDRGATIDALNSLQTPGRPGTALHDAVIRALELVGDAPLPRRAVLLLTDGQEIGGLSQRTRDEVLQAADAGRVPIYTVALGSDADVGLLEELSATAGGASFRATDAEDVAPIFEAIGAALRSQYQVTFDLPVSASAERQLTVGFQVAGARYSTSATFQGTPTEVPAGDNGAGVSPLVLLAIALGTVLLVGGAVVIVRKRRGRAGRVDVESGRGEDAPPVPQPDLVTITSHGSGRLIVIAGPNAGASVSIGGQPVDLGSDPGCALLLDGSNGSVAGTHARVWLQHGRLMLHHLARRQQTLVGQRPIEWATLEPNDTIQIGPHVIAFSLEQ